MNEPQIVTEIRRDGAELGLTTGRIGQELIACASVEDVQSLRNVYLARLVSRDRHISLDLLDGWTVAGPMTEEEFKQWVESRPRPELTPAELIEAAPDQVMDEVSAGAMSVQTLEEIAQEIAGNPEQEPVPLPYALKVEMLVGDMRDLLARQDALEHKMGHLSETGCGSASIVDKFLDASAHATAHDNLDADLTDLSNRVKELEAKHQYGNTDL